jgi:hypothetical protein
LKRRDEDAASLKDKTRQGALLSPKARQGLSPLSPMRARGSELYFGDDGGARTPCSTEAVEEKAAIVVVVGMSRTYGKKLWPQMNSFLYLKQGKEGNRNKKKSGHSFLFFSFLLRRFPETSLPPLLG